RRVRPQSSSETGWIAPLERSVMVGMARVVSRLACLSDFLEDVILRPATLQPQIAKQPAGRRIYNRVST
ncbi:MAG: hypothetical protein ACJ8J0_07925, partial [Longimicrobiaceae bacterium]